MREIENAAKLTVGYLRGYPWGKEPLIKTYEYEFHPGRALGKPPTATCRWNEGFSLISNEPVSGSWYGQRQKLLDQSSKTQRISASSTSSSVIKPNSSPVSSTGATSTKVVGGTSRIASIGKAASANFKTSSSVAKAAVSTTPLVVGTVVSGVAAVFYGVSNIIRYGKSEKSGTQAFKDTVAGSAGVGVSAGLGVAASNVIAGTSLALGSAIVVPIAAGTAVAFAGMKIWNKIFFTRNKYP